VLNAHAGTTEESRGQSYAMKPLRVLIIEDETVIALLFEEVLSEMGHTVCAIERTQAGAVEAAERHKPDLIIVDVRLQSGSGIIAMNAILQSGFVPHLYVSGDVVDRALLNPAAGILQKPFYETQLVKAIERVTNPANITLGQNHAAMLRQMPATSGSFYPPFAGHC
jgi:two-component system, response regulator PdtaR